MTTSRDPDRLLRAWLDLMPDEAPDRVIASVLQATATAPQARVLPWLGPRRSPVNRLSIAAVAAMVVVLIGGAVVLTRFNSNQTNGGPPTPVPSVSPSPTPFEQPAAMPDAVLGDWHADNVSIPGITGAQLVRLSLDWGAGKSGWIQLDGDGSFRQVLQFHSLPAADGELRVRADVTPGCSTGVEGRYQWARSADGLYLTLQLIEDPCLARATAFARTWVHSLSAVTDGGLGILPFDPWIEVTVPKQKMGLGGGTDAGELKTYGDAQPFRALVVIKDVGGFGDPCSTTDTKKSDIGHTTAAFVRYMKAFPGATVKTSNTTIAGKPVVKVDVTIDPGLKCRDDGAQGFHPSLLSDDFAWAWEPGESQTLYIMQFDADTTILIWYEGPAGEEKAVLDSFTFLDQLPTPAT